MKKADMVCLNCIYYAGQEGNCPCRADRSFTLVQITDPDTFWCGSGQWRENGEPVFWGDWEEEEAA